MNPRLDRLADRAHGLGREVLDLLWASSCAACGAPTRPAVSLCTPCFLDLGASAFAGGPRPVRPDPCPEGMPMVWACGEFTGVRRRVITAYKDHGRADLAGSLADDLAMAVAALLRVDPRHLDRAWLDNSVLLVPAPSSGASRRARGEAPIDRLAERTADRLPGRVGAAPVLTFRRRVVDQSHLDHGRRQANLSGAMVVRAAASVQGADCLVVDDVVTTGATLVEAARALRAAGARSVVAATVAATARRAARPAVSERLPGAGAPTSVRS